MELVHCCPLWLLGKDSSNYNYRSCDHAVKGETNRAWLIATYIYVFFSFMLQTHLQIGAGPVSLFNTQTIRHIVEICEVCTFLTCIPLRPGKCRTQDTGGHLGHTRGLHVPGGLGAFGISQEELNNVAGEKDAWVALITQLPRQPSTE